MNFANGMFEHMPKHREKENFNDTKIAEKMG
jgi:hypothetical protein